MADAPVDGREPEQESDTGRGRAPVGEPGRPEAPGRIPVSEAPDLETEFDADPEDDGESDGDAEGGEEQCEPENESQVAEDESPDEDAEDSSVSADEPADDAEPDPAAAEEPEASAADADSDSAEASDADKSEHEDEPEADSDEDEEDDDLEPPAHVALAASFTRIPFSEVPDSDGETEFDGDDHDAASASDSDSAEDSGNDEDEDEDDVPEPARVSPASAFSRVPVSEAPEVEPEENDESEAEPAASHSEAGPDDEDGSEDTEFADDDSEDEPAPTGGQDDAVAEPALLSPESDETTLIPKVTDLGPPDETTAMPKVTGGQPGMAQRPYTPAPAGYRRSGGAPAAPSRPGTGSPRPGYGSGAAAGSGAVPPEPSAQGTQAMPRVPGGAAMPPRPASAGAPRPGAASPRGYRPPEFNPADPKRGQLPPPHNFKLDRRELESEEQPPKNLGRRAMLIGGATAVAAVGGLTLGGVIKLPGTTPSVPTVGFSPAANSGASSATQTGNAFLQAWQNGQLSQAANITDDPASALSVLTAYQKNLNVTGLTINANSANGVGYMTYSVTVEAGTPMGQWTYPGSFAVYSQQVNGYERWFVKWDPAIVYTSMKPGYQLQIKKTPASVKGLVDRNGATIDPTAHPSLAGIVTKLIQTAKVEGATDGQQILMLDEKGTQVATVTTLTDPINNGIVKTTLDMTVQAAAEAAVPAHANSSMVAIQPSTGHILAVANNTGPQYYDDALLIPVAPGSTFKIITSTALLSNNLTTLDSDVNCPATIDVDNQILKNSEGEAGDHTYEIDFATSCNNAFSSFWDNPGMNPDILANAAQTFYGQNQAWDIGLGETKQYMNIPKGLHRGAMAESLVGQGEITSCPLAMCSVAATVATGTFKQPILLPNYKQIAATPMPSSLQGDLKTLMHSVINDPSGTAAEVGFPQNGHFYGKTGTAEVGSGAGLYDNAWFVVFDDQHDIAVCALVVNGSFGASSAAPECLTVFKKLGYA